MALTFKCIYVLYVTIRNVNTNLKPESISIRSELRYLLLNALGINWFRNSIFV